MDSVILSACNYLGFLVVSVSAGQHQPFPAACAKTILNTGHGEEREWLSLEGRDWENLESPFYGSQRECHQIITGECWTLRPSTVQPSEWDPDHHKRQVGNWSPQMMSSPPSHSHHPLGDHPACLSLTCCWWWQHGFYQKSQSSYTFIFPIS